MDRYERKKRLFILLWTVLCSFVLWAMSLVDMQSFAIGSFLWFTIFLFGGGVAYHFLTVMLRTQINPNNAAQWDTSIRYTVLSALIVASVAAVALFEKYIYSFGGTLTFLGILLAIFIIPTLAERSIAAFSRIEPH